MIFFAALLLTTTFNLAPTDSATAAKAPKEQMLALPPAALPPSTNEKSTILIQAKSRAEDLVQAFETFKKEKPTYRISARLANGTSLTNIQELIPMTNGTLFVARTTTTMGPKTQLVSVDELVDFYFP